MSERIDRFHQRKARQAQAPSEPCLVLMPAPDALQAFTTGAVDQAFLARLAAIDSPVDLTVGRAEVEALLKELADGYDKARFDRMLGECKQGIVGAIAGPFGMGRLVGALDKTGGNVDTIHNAREGVWATEGAKQAYDNRGDYNKKMAKKYHQHKNYKATNAEYSQQFKHSDAGAEDIYRDQQLKHSHGDKMHLDHVRSAKETHDDAGVYLAGLDPKDVANRSANLGPTSESINTSKEQLTPAEYLEYLRRKTSSRKAIVEKLQSKEALTGKESAELKKLLQQEQVQEERVKQADKRATEDRERLVNGTYYESKKFVADLAKTSATEAGKMALQQALGEALSEFFVAAIDEVRDWYAHGHQEVMLATRLKRIADRVASRWKHFRDVAIQGAISGFLSNLATVVINMVATTQKRLVRMIREGFFSLLRALKLLLFPPEGMTFRQAAHEASKLAFAGGILVGGIVLEEVILRQLQAFGFGFIADIATAVIVGSLTAIAMALTAYALDRLDLLGVGEEAQHTHTMQVLDQRIETSIEASECLLLELQRPELTSTV